MQMLYVVAMVFMLMTTKGVLSAPQQPIPTTIEQLRSCIKNPLTALDNCRKSCDSRAAVLDKFKCELACFMKFHEQIQQCSALEWHQSRR